MEKPRIRGKQKTFAIRRRAEGETDVRKGWMICSAATLLATVAPADAQFGAPFGAPFGGGAMLTSPEAAGSAIGAGVGQQQQQCSQVPNGRSGYRTVCTPYSSGTDQRR
jgi:hypothetical protein